MEEDKTLEVASTLEEMSKVLEQLVEFSKNLVKQFAETGSLTVEEKKDFDSLVFESENCLKKSSAVLDSNESPM